jgi:hypothetical protein
MIVDLQFAIPNQGNFHRDARAASSNHHSKIYMSCRCVVTELRRRVIALVGFLYWCCSLANFAIGPEAIFRYIIDFYFENSTQGRTVNIMVTAAGERFTVSLLLDKFAIFVWTLKK